MRLTDYDVQRAERRMQARLKDHSRAVAARYDKRAKHVVVRMKNRMELAVPVALVQELAGARPGDLCEIEIDSLGLALHWPKLEADVYVPALLEGVFGTRRWKAQLLGKAGGEATSPAKAAAARANGRRGGRPRKQP